MTAVPDKDKLARDQELADVKHVMSTAIGRRFMWRLLAEARMFAPTFTGNSTTFYNEGRRELGLRFYHDVMEACPELFGQAQKEHSDREKAEV